MGGDEVGEEEWEEERHLDNAAYLLYRWVAVLSCFAAVAFAAAAAAAISAVGGVVDVLRSPVNPWLTLRCRCIVQ